MAKLVIDTESASTKAGGALLVAAGALVHVGAEPMGKGMCVPTRRCRRPVGSEVAVGSHAMAEITIFHNPNCSSSRAATEAAEELGVDVDIRRYQLKAERPSIEELRDLLAILEDEPTALVRRDANFAKLGLTDTEVQSAEQVAEVLAAHPELIQRPVLIADGAAVIGRPKDRIVPFLTTHA